MIPAIGEEDGLPEACNVTLHNLQTVAKDAVGRRITSLEQEHLEKIERAIAYALGFGEIV